MQASRDGETAIGNSEAAEAFASAINSMLLKHELEESDITYAANRDDDPIVQLSVDLSRYRIEKKKQRIAWQEQLARIVAQAHLCRFLIYSGSNRIVFVGTHSHTTVAEYVYGTLVPAAKKLCAQAYQQYGMEDSPDGKWRAREPGFNESWMSAFILRISERFDEARKTAITEIEVGGTTQALIRLGGALIKAQQYIDDKFKGTAAPLQRIHGNHGEGRARGRAAADAITIGRRGVSAAPKCLTS